MQSIGPNASNVGGQTSDDAVHVVAAVIYSPQGDQVLISRRHSHLHQGGKWEFPGGKVEAGESVEGALAREIDEELGLAIDGAGSVLLHRVVHDYPDRKVDLQFWQVTAFSGEPRGREQQEIRWVEIHRLGDFDFPEANRAVVDKLMVNLGG